MDFNRFIMKAFYSLFSAKFRSLDSQRCLLRCPCCYSVYYLKFVEITPTNRCLWMPWMLFFYQGKSKKNNVKTSWGVNYNSVFMLIKISTTQISKFRPCLHLCSPKCITIYITPPSLFITTLKVRWKIKLWEPCIGR